MNPDILLIDEVLGVGDMRFQEKCLERMLSFRDTGRTIIFVSHHLESVAALCPACVLLVYGEVKLVGPTPDVIATYVRPGQEAPDDEDRETGLWDVSLRDERRAPLYKVTPGQRALLTFALKADVPVEQCVLRLLVERASDGLPVCEYSLPLRGLAGARPLADAVTGAIALDMNLLRGAYTVSLTAFQHPGVRRIARLRNCLSFFVDDGVGSKGMAHLNPALLAEAEGTGASLGTADRS